MANICNFSIKVDGKTYNIKNTGIDNSYDSFTKSLRDLDIDTLKTITKALNDRNVFEDIDINEVKNQSVGLFSSTDLVSSLGRNTELTYLLKQLPFDKKSKHNIVMGYAGDDVKTGFYNNQLFVNLNYDYDKANKVKALFELAIHDKFPEEYTTLSEQMLTNSRTSVVDKVLEGIKDKDKLTSIILNAYSNVDINSIFKSNEVSIDLTRLTPLALDQEAQTLDFAKDYAPQEFADIYSVQQGDLLGIKIPGTNNLHFETFIDFIIKDDKIIARTISNGNIFKRVIKSTIPIKRKVSEVNIAPIKGVASAKINIQISKSHKISVSDLYKLINLGYINNVGIKNTEGKTTYSMPKVLQGNTIDGTALKEVSNIEINLPTNIQEVKNPSLEDYIKTSNIKIGDIALIETNKKLFNVFIIGKSGDSYLYLKNDGEKYTTGSTFNVLGILNTSKGWSENELKNVDFMIGKFQEKDPHISLFTLSVSDGYEEMPIEEGNVLVDSNGIKYKVFAVGKTVRVGVTDNSGNLRFKELKRSELSKYKVLGDFRINSASANLNIWKNRARVGDFEMTNAESIPCKVYMNPTNKFVKVLGVDETASTDLVDVTAIYKTYLENKYNTSLSGDLKMYRRGNIIVKNDAQTVHFNLTGEDISQYIIPGSFIRFKGDINSYIVERISKDGIVVSKYGYSQTINNNILNKDLKYVKQYTKIANMQDAVDLFMPKWANYNIDQLNGILKADYKASFEVELSDNDSPEIIYNISKLLEEKYGVKINLIGNSDLENFPELGENAARVRAFTSNGEVYVNVEKASIEEPLHELLHLVLATMKAENSSNYYNLVSMVQGHPLFSEVEENYNEVNTDILEETFIRLLTQTFKKNIDKSGVFNEVVFMQSLKSAIHSMFDLNVDLDEDYVDLLNSPVSNILSDFESSLIMNKEGLISKEKSIAMMEVASTLRNMLNSKQLVETC